MKLENLKDVIQLHQLADSWLSEYDGNNLGSHSKKLKKQCAEMRVLKAKTGKILEKQAGDIDTESSNPSGLYDEIVALAQSAPVFSICFGPVEHYVDDQPVSKETALTAIKLKKMTASWFGIVGDAASSEEISLLTNIYECAKKTMSAPKTLDGDMLTIDFYGSSSSRCRKMRRTMEFLQDEYEGLINVVINVMEDEDDSMHKLGIENLPTMIFKRGKKKIAKHEGDLSISATQSKVNTLMDGANISDSSSVKSIKDMKAVNKKELYAMGEYLLFYFEAHWCGICKKTTPVIQQYARSYSKVKFEDVQVDGTHSLHKSFGVTEIPSLVFVRDGKIIGKHVGYINPSNLQKLLEKFAESNKHKIGFTKSKESSIIRGEEQTVKDKNKKKAKIKTKE